MTETVEDRWALLLTTIRTVGAAPSCPHIADPGAAFWCGRHTDAGLLCPSCYEEHRIMGQHLGFGCDSCGERPAEPFLLPPVLIPPGQVRLAAGGLAEFEILTTAVDLVRTCGTQECGEALAARLREMLGEPVVG